MDVQAWLEERDRKLIHEHRQEARREGSFLSLRHQFGRRLRRALTNAEQVALSRHLDTDGAIHVSEIVLDLSPDELTSYLAKTNDR